MRTKGKRPPKRPRFVQGVIDVTRSGKGFLITPEGEDDIMIFREELGGALSGDIVEVEVFERRGRKLGIVRDVLERKRTSFVGTIRRENGYQYLVPDDKRVYVTFAVVGGVGTPPGQKVLADVVRWEADPPQVTVRRALGVAGAHDTEMRAILAGHNFDTDFPQDVAREAESLSIAESEYATRRDFRDTLTVTIDPEDAKDHDDAISFKTLKDGTAEVGIHIADVSHFVRAGSHLDREAQKRGTSVYLVDRTIPMLPARLSEDLCSLLPQVDRLAYSAVFTFKGTAIIDRWFGRSVIRVDHKLSYEQGDASLEDPSNEHHDALTALSAIAQHLRKKRVEMGALIFDRDEIKPVLNERKEVVAFKRNAATPAHQLIEELMLLGNREVAGLVRRAVGKNRVFVYRIHDVPNAEKLEELAVFLRAIGHQLAVTQDGATPREINRMLESIKGTPEENMIKVATIRTMAKAVYSTKNIGHFGLSFKDYTHFTSPIRRYPDILAHRALTAVLKNETHAGSSTLEELAIHASEREAEAAEAERASVRLKQAEYMQGKIGEARTGVISGVTEWGIYVEDHESGAEGMARLESLTDDTYEYEPKKFAAIGRRSKRILRLGDQVQFRVTRADPIERVIDLEITFD